MLLKRLYYLYLAGVLIWRLRRLNLGGGDALGGPATTPLNGATTQRRFVEFFASLYKASCLRLFAVSRLF